MINHEFIKREEFGARDDLWELFVWPTSENPYQQKTLQEWYDEVSQLKSQVLLTEESQKRLNEIKNLLVYSWNVYSFASTAFLLSLILMEVRIRENGFLAEGQHLGNFANNRSAKSGIPDAILEELSSLVKTRNGMAHSRASILPPHHMISLKKSSIDIVDKLTIILAKEKNLHLATAKV